MTSFKIPKNLLRLPPLLICALFCGVPVAQASSKPALPAALQKALGAGAAQAQTCHVYMHEDADEYVSCMDALLGRVRAPDADATRLGIAYYALVGALNSARVSLPGAEAASRKYFQLVRQLQARVKIDDDALCPVVAGDCASRLATLQRMQQEGKQKAR